METLRQKWRKNNKLVTSELRKLAAEHAATPGSKLTLIPDNPKLHKGQGIHRKVPVSDAASPEMVLALAGVAEPMFGGMLELAREQQEETGLFTTLGEVARSGQSFTTITLHEHEADATDIAFGQGVIQCMLAELNYRPRFGNVVSKIMPHLGYRFKEDNPPTPTVSALQLMGDVFLSFPRTPAIQNSAIAEDFVGAYNANMRLQAHHAKKKGNYVLGVAPTGTRGRIDEEDPMLTHILGVNPATVKLISGLVVPVLIRMQYHEPFFEVLTPVAINDMDDMNNTMLTLCRATEERANDGRRILFHPFEDAA